MTGVDMQDVLDVLAGSERTEIQGGITRDQALNLMTELERLEVLAREARRRLDRGVVRSGASSLYRIETRAADTRRWIGMVLGGAEDRAEDAQRWAHAVLADRRAA